MASEKALKKSTEKKAIEIANLWIDNAIKIIKTWKKFNKKLASEMSK